MLGLHSFDTLLRCFPGINSHAGRLSRDFRGLVLEASRLNYGIKKDLEILCNQKSDTIEVSGHNRLNNISAEKRMGVWRCWEQKSDDGDERERIRGEMHSSGMQEGMMRWQPKHGTSPQTVEGEAGACPPASFHAANHGPSSCTMTHKSRPAQLIKRPHSRRVFQSRRVLFASPPLVACAPLHF